MDVSTKQVRQNDIYSVFIYLEIWYILLRYLIKIDTTQLSNMSIRKKSLDEVMVRFEILGLINW